MSSITGQTLQDWGFAPGRWFKDGLAQANAMRAKGCDDSAIFAHLQTLVPVETLMRTNDIPYGVFLDAIGEAERANAQDVFRHMDALMRVPTIVKGAVMPDACPSGAAEGTIPVGGAVACAEAIHPGFHSADICCSVAMTLLRRIDNPKAVLDAVQAATHFGPGGRPKVLKPPEPVMAQKQNP